MALEQRDLISISLFFFSFFPFFIVYVSFLLLNSFFLFFFPLNCFPLCIWRQFLVFLLGISLHLVVSRGLT